MISHKAQGWGFDALIAMALFLIGVLLFYFFIVNYGEESEEIYQTLNYEASVLSNALLSQGYPVGWNKDSVIQLGIMSQDRVNTTKLQFMYELSKTNYPLTKQLLGITHDYYFHFSDSSTMIFEGQPVEFIGAKPNNPDNLIRTTRYIIYNNKPVTLYVYVWS